MLIPCQDLDPTTILKPQGQQPNDNTNDMTKDQHRESNELPFPVFTKWEKIWINPAASFAGIFSTLSSYIYYPALVPVAQELGVSITLINLTVTSYLVVAAIAPAFMGDMADQSGRRPIYVLMFSLMIGANIGIALQKSFTTLLILRMLQSAGSSGVIGHFSCAL